MVAISAMRKGGARLARGGEWGAAMGARLLHEAVELRGVFLQPLLHIRFRLPSLA